ncbi:MAG: tyrosine-type recombinase/integrase [Actinomycetota bacterium]
MDNREILKKLITSRLDDLDEVLLSQCYTNILRLDPVNSRKKIADIKKEYLIDDFLNMKLDISENTAKNYKSVLSAFLNYTYPNLGKDEVAAYINRVKGIWSTNTRRRNYIFIKNFLSHIYRSGYLEEKISDIIKIPKKTKVEKFIPDDDDIELFFSTIKKMYKDNDSSLRYTTIFSIYAKTSLRLYELINLNYQDIDFPHNRIYLNQTKNGDKDYLPMDSQLKEIILRYANRFRITKGSLIRGKGGKRINKNVINNNLKKIVREAGLPKGFSAHGFRRYFIDKQKRAKTDVFVLSELARHKDLNTTYGYLRVTEEEKIAAMANIQIAV